MNQISKIKKYEQQVINSYEHYSIIPFACKPEAVDINYEHGKFKKFANNLKFEKNMMFDDVGIMNFGSIGIDVAHAETNEIVNIILKECPMKKIDSSPTKEILLEEIARQKKAGFNPNFMFVPIDYYTEIWKWSIPELTLANFDGQGGYVWKIDSKTTLKIKYSNQRTPFKHFIISDSRYNIWQYRPDIESEKRLTVKMEAESDPNFAFLFVQTIFKFNVKNKKANSVLEFKPQKS